MMDINPFYQAISAMQDTVQNLTQGCEAGKRASQILMARWARFDAKINHLYGVLSVIGSKGMKEISESANVVFQAHNQTLFQIYYIRNTLTKSFYVLNETVNANIKLQGMTIFMHHFKNSNRVSSSKSLCIVFFMLKTIPFPLSNTLFR